MYIEKVEYKQFVGDGKYWAIKQVEFDKINLIVGKNSSGKSKTIALINSLSRMLSDNIKLPFEFGHYIVQFRNNRKQKIEFELEYSKKVIIKENLIIDDEIKIKRKKNGEGTIMTKKDEIHEFKIPTDELKATRRDTKVYPYLEDLNHWATHVRTFFFNTPLGQDKIRTNSQQFEFSLKDTSRVLDIFAKGKTKYGQAFLKKIIADFNEIGYNINKVYIGKISSWNISINNLNIELSGLIVQEKDLKCPTEQGDMSTGMFRALSIIIHFNYYELEKIPGCVLIDDIGEGLDFERSTNLIKLLIKKVENVDNKMQLFLTTNDQFVMNSVDLKYWQIIERQASEVNYHNIKNSPEIFEDFRFTGLNNFDFFATDFYKSGLE